MKVEIEIEDSLYQDYKHFLKKRFLEEGDTSKFIEQLIYMELVRSCEPGYDRDATTTCKTRTQLERDIRDEVSDGISNENFTYKRIYHCFDIDKFKSYNDRHNIQKGNEVLKQIAVQLIERHGSKNVYRWGGEEFVVLADSDCVSKLQLADEITIKHSIVIVDTKIDKHNPLSDLIDKEILLHIQKGILSASCKGEQLNFSDTIA